MQYSIKLKINKVCIGRTFSEYKRFSKKLNQVKSASKKAYFSKRFEACNINLRATWTLIGTLIKQVVFIYPVKNSREE